MENQSFELLKSKDSYKLAYLNEKLRTINSDSIFISTYEEDIDDIINNGISFGKTYKIVKGEDSQCHKNCCLIYILQNTKEIEQNPPFNIGEIDIYTGYAIANDKKWNQHTWCVGRKGKYNNKVIETTERRTQYFGFKLEGNKLLTFLNDNYY